MLNKMRPIHPGEILQDELNELGLSAKAFAEKLKVPTNRITTILHGQRSITADTALRFAHYFGTSAEFWLNLQTTYDLKITEHKSGKRIAREVAQRGTAACGNISLPAHDFG